MKAIGQFAGGINAYNAGKYTRSVMSTNAHNSLNAGVSERDMIRARSGEAIGAQITAQGGSGFQTGTGSALDLLKASAANRELDLLTSRTKAANQATDFTQRGAIAYAQGKSALAGGILSGAATIASDVAGAFGGAGGAGGGGGVEAPDMSSDWYVSLGSPSAASSVPDMSSMGFGG